METHSFEKTCPTRVDLCGGTIDIWPIHHMLNYKKTVNVAVDIKTKAKLTLKEGTLFSLKSVDQNISVEGTYSDICQEGPLDLVAYIVKSMWPEDGVAFDLVCESHSPKGAGMGGSSSLAISLIYCLAEAALFCGYKKTPLTEKEAVALAGDIEAKLIKTPTGVQDYWAAVRGGLNILTYDFGQTKVDTFTSCADLTDCMLLCFSGQSRQSAINNWQVFKQVFDHDQKLIEQLNQIGFHAEICAEHLKKNNIWQALCASRDEWLVRKKIWPGIVTFATEKVEEVAMRHGAFFTRVCGAGGGGVVAIFSEPERKQTIRKALEQAELGVLDASLFDLQPGFTGSKPFQASHAKSFTL